jgi:hypothetical protein
VNQVFRRLEQTFLEYTQKYDSNIKTLVKERGIELSTNELEEILDDAKNRL